MINLIVRYRIITNTNSPTLVTGNYIDVNWDDSASAFVVYKYADSTLTSPTTITTGPDLGADRIDFEAVTATRPIPYSFCDGTDLQTFGRSSTFPYANKNSTPNHFSCVASVCDLAFSDIYNVVDASGLETNDGAISVTATSSQSNIRYSLDPDFDYSAGQGQPDGNFLNLYSGDYTITAKDSLGCVAQITLTVGIPDTYGVHYRLEFTDQYNRDCRLDIEERGYSGAVVEVCGSEDPIVIRYNGDGELDKFTPIIPSELEGTLIAEENFQFIDLFTQDERKYKVKFYCDYGNTIAATPEVPGDVVPINLDALANWSQFKNFATYPNWAAGSTRTVTFTPYEVVTSKGTIQTIRTSSATLYTEYAFVEGYDYDFTIHFTTDGTNRIHLRIVDDFGVTQFSSYTDFTPGTSSVNIAFTATTSCKQVYVSVSNSSLAETDVELTNITGSVTSPTIPATDASPAGLELQWQGYIIGSNYQEAYIAPPYPVTFIATDGLADLKNYDFSDALNNLYTEDVTVLKAITDMLSRTDLGCNFISAINKYEENMSQGAGDDPLNQCKFDPNTFYQGGRYTDGFTAISEIIKSFGARLQMRKGKFIAYLAEQAVGSMAYREFSSRGVYVTNGTINDTKSIQYPIIESGANFRNRDQVLEILPTYGIFLFEHTLIKAPSLIGSYSFEEVDVYEDVDGTKLFKNWNVNIGSSPGATFGIKETKSFEGDYNFFYKIYYLTNPTTPYVITEPVDLSTVTSGYQRVTLSSLETLIEYNDQDILEFKFNYAAILARYPGRNTSGWVRLKWMIKVGSKYYNEEDGWIADADGKYNDIYVDDYNDSKDFKILIKAPESSVTVEESLQVEFVFETKWTFDFLDDSYSTFSIMKALPTVDMPIGKRIRGTVLLGDGSRRIAEFILEDVENSKESDPPLYILPDDHHATDNNKIWKNNGQETYISLSEGLKYFVPTPPRLEYWYLDNVVVKHYPNGSEPPSNVTIERTNNRNIKVDFHGEYLLNDVDIDNINNSERTYINFYKLLDGTPTQVWERTYRAGTGKLMTLLSSEVISQYQKPAAKLTGSILCNDEVLPTSVLQEVNDLGNRYMFMGYELHAKSSTVVFDMAQIKDVVTDTTSDDVDAGFTTGFTLGFRS